MVIGSSSPAQAAGSAPPTISARSAGIRLAALFGPAIFGVTAAGVALPDVAIAMDAQLSAAAWVLTAHALALGAGTALFGRLSDSRGVRLSLIIGSVALATGAVVCVVAPSLDVLVAGRFILAAGSGAMSSSALVLAAAAEPAHRPRILAIVGAGMALFSAGSVLAGGMVTDWISWRVTLVLPALSLFAVPFSLREAAARPGSGRPVDFPGAAMLTAAAAAALTLIRASSLDLGAAAVTMTALLLIFATTGLVLWTAGPSCWSPVRRSASPPSPSLKS
ncbi:MFS transporter [Phytoactinopolyspora limicola]|uniref:MFS transporter n=1 Tax=Phytoactinopolyspora limicola TaxID=2715536 RepID=UPI00140C2C32|nr:MFS transporter [Phytoactinopolyspora limicola]